jgi:uncharacterized protein (DUF2267 family)
MTYEEFIERVQEQADLTRDEASQATRVTLATLGERIYRTEREDLAAQLPPQLGAQLSERQPGEVTRQDVDRFPLEEFYNRVSGRLDIGFPQGKRRAQVVVAVLQEAVSPEQMAAVREALPAEYGELVG